jgi:hypothetical protein
MICAFATRIYNCKSSSKDAMWYPMAYEPPSKSHKQLDFHLFWDATKNGLYKCIFHLRFYPNQH